MEKENKINLFQVIVFGIVFNPEKRTILIGRRKNNPYSPQPTWGFPGGELNREDEIDKALKKKIKKQTGLVIKNLGAIFVKTIEEKKDLVTIYFLCEAIKGKLKAGDDLKELKWIRAKEIEKHFTTPFHPRLREYLLNIG